MYSTGNGGQLYVQPYPSGELRRITTDMMEYRNASMTRDGKSLLSVTFEASTRLSLMALAGGEERRLPELRTAGSTGVAWSPTEPRIFYIKVVGSELQIWTMGIDGSEPREVLAKVRPAGLAVSVDGSSIFYSAERDDVVGLWRARSDGSEPRRLAAVEDPTWITLARDGRSLYFTSSTGGTPTSYRLSTDGGEPVLVAPLFERATPSPDGRLLAGIYRANLQAPLTLGVLDAGSGKPVNVITDYSPASGSGGFAWTQDGKSLLFTTTERFNLWRQPAMGDHAKRSRTSPTCGSPASRSHLTEPHCCSPAARPARRRADFELQVSAGRRPDLQVGRHETAGSEIAHPPRPTLGLDPREPSAHGI